MKILAIETSCDDTGIAILEAKNVSTNTKFKIISNKVHTQVIHSNYGGVFPMMAKREHGTNIIPTLHSVLSESDLFKEFKSTKLDKKKEISIKKILSRESGLGDRLIEFVNRIKKPEIDAIAVTVGPGLEPALWVGISFARALATAWDLQIVPVNHMEGHVLSTLVNKKKTFTYSKKTFEFPVLSLLISGGHTEIVLMKEFGKYKIIGKTRDDAVGEAFDKVARMLGLPYPGGIEVSKIAEVDRSENKKSEIKFPRPMINTNDFDFSFSGLKTAVLYFIRENGPLTESLKKEIAREFEDAVVDVLVTKTIKAIKKHGVKYLIVGGGVSANEYLQIKLREAIKNNNLKTKSEFPIRGLNTDNALMIAIAGYFQYKNKKVVKSTKKIKAQGNLVL